MAFRTEATWSRNSSGRLAKAFARLSPITRTWPVLIIRATVTAEGITTGTFTDQVGVTEDSGFDVFGIDTTAELEGDLDTTMATMSEAPHLNHVPTMAGGVGREGEFDGKRDPIGIAVIGERPERIGVRRGPDDFARAPAFRQSVLLF